MDNSAVFKYHQRKFLRRTRIASSNALTTSLVPVGAISNSRRWLIVALLFAASLVNYVDRGTISVALPFIAHDLHFGPEVKGALLAAFFFSYALMQIPIGWAVDRFNLRPLYAVMFLIWCGAQGLTGLAGGLFMLIALRMLLGIGESIYFPASVKIVSVMFAPEDRGLPGGLFNAGATGGLVAGAPLTALLIARFGWRGMFVLVGAAALLWLVPWLTVFPSRFPKCFSAANGAAGSPRPNGRRLVTFDRNLAGICLGFFCWDYYLYLMLTWLPDYFMSVRHFPLFAAGISTALPFLIYTIGQPLGGWISDWFIRRGWNETAVRKSVLTIAFLCGLLLIPATLVRSATAALWLIAGAGFVGFAGGTVYVFPQSCAPEEEVGIWTGIMNFAGNIGGVLAPLATGLLIGRTGSYAPGFAIGPALLLAGILSYWFMVGDVKGHVPRRASP